VIISAYLFEKLAMITRVSSVIRPKGCDLIFDHPYNADYERLTAGRIAQRGSAQIIHSGVPIGCR
jgi:hypothetical protein